MKVKLLDELDDCTAKELLDELLEIDVPVFEEELEDD